MANVNRPSQGKGREGKELHSTTLHFLLTSELFPQSDIIIAAVGLFIGGGGIELVILVATVSVAGNGRRLRRRIRK